MDTNTKDQPAETNNGKVPSTSLISTYDDPSVSDDIMDLVANVHSTDDDNHVPVPKTSTTTSTTSAQVDPTTSSNVEPNIANPSTIMSPSMIESALSGAVNANSGGSKTESKQKNESEEGTIWKSDDEEDFEDDGAKDDNDGAWKPEKQRGPKSGETRPNPHITRHSKPEGFVLPDPSTLMPPKKKAGKRGMKYDESTGRWTYLTTGKPVGRAPKGCVWNVEGKRWEYPDGSTWEGPASLTNAPNGGKEIKFKRPPGRGKKGFKWDYDNGGWVEDENYKEVKEKKNTGKKKLKEGGSGKRRKFLFSSKESSDYEWGSEDEYYYGDSFTREDEESGGAPAPKRKKVNPAYYNDEDGAVDDGSGDWGDNFKPSDRNPNVQMRDPSKRIKVKKEKGEGVKSFYHGQFPRPKGRAPKGAEIWDSSQGCWIMTDGTPMFVGDKTFGENGLKGMKDGGKITFTNVAGGGRLGLGVVRRSQMSDGWGSFSSKTGVVRPLESYPIGIRPLNVVVIGAGISGIACAREMLSRGHRVIVLEGRKRVGGRLNTAHIATTKDKDGEENDDKAVLLPHISTTLKHSRLPDPTICPVDMGGMFIHGIDSNPIFNLAAHTGIRSKAMSTTIIYDVDGRVVDEDVDKRTEKIWNEVLDKAHNEGRRTGYGIGKMMLQQDQPVEEEEANDDEEGEDEGEMEVLWTKSLTQKGEKDVGDAGSNAKATDDDLVPPAPSASESAPSNPAPPPSASEPVSAQTAEGEGEPENEGEIPVEPKVEKPPTTTTIYRSFFVPDHITEKESFQQTIDRTSSETISKLSPEELKCFNWHKANLELSCGVDLTEVGREWNEDEVWGFEGDHHMLSEGFQPFVTNMANGVNIRFGVEVEKVVLDEELRVGGNDWGENIFTDLKKAQGEFFSEKGGGGVQVVSKDGEVFRCDAVVCTAPLGVLKTDMIKFDPPLKQRKREAIEKVGFGVLNKCALSFEKRFWDDEDFIGHAAEFHNKSPIMFTNISRLDGKPVICAMFGGSFAATVEGWRDEKVVSEVLKVLKLIYGVDIPDPIDTFVTRWKSDRYARGSFCYVPPGVTGVEHSELERPCFDKDGNMRLLFAGEHTSTTHPSTIHGAYMSGIREAYRLDLTYHGEGNNDLKFDWTGSTIYSSTFGLGETFQLKLVKDLPNAKKRPLGRARQNMHWDYIKGEWVDEPVPIYTGYYERVEGVNKAPVGRCPKDKVWNKEVAFYEDLTSYVGGGAKAQMSIASSKDPVEHSLFSGNVEESVEEGGEGDAMVGNVEGGGEVADATLAGQEGAPPAPFASTPALDDPSAQQDQGSVVVPLQSSAPAVIAPEDFSFAALAPSQQMSGTSQHIYTEAEDRAILRAAEIFEGEDFAEEALPVVGALSELTVEEIKDRYNSLYKGLLERNSKVTFGRWG